MHELQGKLQGQGGGVRHIVVSVPHTVRDNDALHQLPLTSKLL